MPAPSPTPPPLTRPVSSSERLFSSEVAAADRSDTPKPLRDTAYVFSNGRTFVENVDPYAE